MLHRPGIPPRSRAAMIAAEVVLAVASAAVMTAWGLRIDVDPLERVGQVSALASLQVPFALLAAAPVAAVALAVTHPGWRPWTERAACAVLAGATSGFVAGAMAVALRDTPLWLGGQMGDARNIMVWARDLLEHGSLEVGYPPGVIVGLAFTSVVTDQSPILATKPFMLVVTALTGPVGYLAWRLLARPVVALAAGVVAALPLVDPYKPVGNAMLPLVVVGVVVLVRLLRDAPRWSPRRAVMRGVALGAGVGLVFLGYTGWFLWTAPAAVVVVLAALPWHAARRRAAWGRVLALLGACGAAFVAVAAVHLVPLLGADGILDDFVYFDALVDPGYVVMWRSGTPGAPPEWPPPGELGGVGVFMTLLAVAVGAGAAELAVLSARLRRADGPGGAGPLLRGESTSRDILLVCLAALASTWLMRHLVASRVAATGNVGLWPRTSAELTHLCLVVIVVVLAVAVRAALAARPVPGPTAGLAEGAVVLASVVCGAVLLAVAASSISDRYMPQEPAPEATVFSLANLAWLAHTQRLPDGTCPARAPGGTCTPMW